MKRLILNISGKNLLSLQLVLMTTCYGLFGEAEPGSSTLPVDHQNLLPIEIPSSPLEPKPLPDNLDYPTAKAKYELVLEASVHAKSHAQKANANLLEKLNNQTKFGNDKLSLQAALAKNETKIQELENEIPALQSQITKYETEIHQINANNQSMSRQIAHLSHQLEITIREQDLVISKRDGMQPALERSRIKRIATSHAQTDLQNELNDLREQLRLTQEELGQLQIQKTNLTNKLQNGERDLPNLVKQKGAFEAQISQMQANANSIIGNISKATEELQTAQTELAAAKASEHSAMQALKGAETQGAESLNEVKKAQGKLNQMKNQADKIVAQINELQSQIGAQQRKLQDLEIRVAELEHEFNDSNTPKEKLAALKIKLAQVSHQVNTVTQNLQSNQNKLAAANSTLSEKMAAVQIAVEALALAEAEARPLQQTIQQLSAELQEKKNITQQKQATFSREQTQLQELKATKAALDKAINQAQTQLAKNASEISELTTNIPKWQATIGRVEEKIPNKQARLGELKTKIQQLTAVLPAIQHDHRLAQDELNRLEEKAHYFDQDISALNQQLRSLKNHINQLQDDIVWGQQRINDLNQAISSNSDRIRYDQNVIPELIERSNQLHAEITKISNDLVQATNDFESAQKKFKTAETDYQTKLQIAEKTYAQLLMIKKNYQLLLAEAKKVGNQRGKSMGSKGGGENGKLDGDTQGAIFGLVQGKILGLLVGFENGKKEGTKLGQLEGKKHGASAPNLDPDATNAGLESGVRAAKAVVNSTTYLDARQEYEKTLLHIPVSGPIDIVNPEGFTLPAVSLVAMDSSDGADFKTLPARPSKKPKSPDSEPPGLKVCTDLTDPTSFHKRPDEITAPPTECKNLTHAIEVTTCTQAFFEAYKKTWNSSYKKAFTAPALKACQLSFSTSYEATKTLRFDEGFKQTYELAFKDAEKTAAVKAKKMLYLEARKKAYNDNIENLKVEASQTAINDLNSQFNSSSVLTLDKIEAKVIEDSPFYDEGYLTLDISVLVSNHSPSVDSDLSEARVRVIPLTKNLAIENKTPWAKLATIPRATQASVRGLGTVLLRKTIKEPEIIKLKVNLVLANGKVLEDTLEVKF
jgi:predicted  nucleic acid-binding Zn-ribbon protein